jgi:vitamin B12 transporter
VNSSTTRTLVLGLLLLSPRILGAQITARDSVYEVTPLTVTAERLAVPPSAVSSSLTILQGNELRARGVATVADALREVPGAMVVSTGSYGGQTSLFLRGGESDYVKVLIDGVAVNQAGGAFNFNALTLDDIERIEVVRGPASVLYGTDAVTGVVHLITRSGRGPLAFDGAVRGGGDGTVRAELAAGAGTGRFSWTFGGSSERSDGIYAFNSGWRSSALAGQARLQLTEATAFRASLRFGDDRFHYPTDGGGIPVDSNTVNTHAATTLNLGVDHALDPAIRFSAQATLHREEQGSSNRRDSQGDTLGFGYASRASADLLRQAVEARLTVVPDERWSMVYGMELRQDQEERHEGYSVSNFGFGEDSSVTAPVDHERRNVGVFLQALVAPVDGWTLSGGVRLDEDEAFGQFLTTRAGIVRRLNEATRLRASYGTAFKTPTLEETYGNSAFSIGDPELDPERSESWEIGAERSFLDDRVVAAVVWFDQKFRDLIQYGFTAPGAPTYYNVAAATSRGLDVSVTARPHSRGSVTAAITRLFTEVTDPGFSSGDGDVFVQGEELIRRPGWSGRLGASWLVGSRTRLGGEFTYVGERTDVDFGPFPSQRVELPGYALFDLSADVEVLRQVGERRIPGVSLTLRVENALDEEYETVVGFAGRGRRVLGGVRARW